MRRIAVFDFCETISTFQTFDPFLLFVLEQEYPDRYAVLRNRILIRLINGIGYIVRRFKPTMYIYKYVLVYATRGIPEYKLWEYGQMFYKYKIKKNLIPKTIELIKSFEHEGYENIIVSGGSKYYIRFFSDEYGINAIKTAEIKMKNGISTGFLINDCLGDNKVECLKQFECESRDEVSFEYAISDSVSDIPLFFLCRKQIVISKREHQEWIKEGMEEIIWD